MPIYGMLNSLGWPVPSEGSYPIGPIHLQADYSFIRNI